jgi:hypothetical protein
MNSAELEFLFERIELKKRINIETNYNKISQFVKLSIVSVIISNGYMAHCGINGEPTLVTYTLSVCALFTTKNYVQISSY